MANSNITNLSISESYKRLTIKNGSVTDGTGSVISTLILPPIISGSILIANSLRSNSTSLRYDGTSSLQFTSESVLTLKDLTFFPKREVECFQNGFFFSGSRFYLFGDSSSGGTDKEIINTEADITPTLAAKSLSVSVGSQRKSYTREFQLRTIPLLKQQQAVCLPISYSLCVSGYRNFTTLTSLSSATASFFVTSSEGTCYGDSFSYCLQCLETDGIGVGQTFSTGSSGVFCLNLTKYSTQPMTASISGDCLLFQSNASVKFWIPKVAVQETLVNTCFTDYTASLSGSFLSNHSKYFNITSSHLEALYNITGSSFPVSYKDTKNSLIISLPVSTSFFGYANTVYQFLNYNGSSTNERLTYSLGAGANTLQVNFCKYQNPAQLCGSKPEGVTTIGT